MAAGVLGEAEGDGEGEHPACSRPPHQHGERRGRDEEQRHAAGEGGHDERDQPAMPQGLDQKGLCDPIEPGEEIAEAEPEADHRRAFEPRARASHGRGDSRRAARPAARRSGTSPARDAAGRRRAPRARREGWLRLRAATLRGLRRRSRRGLRNFAFHSACRLVPRSPTLPSPKRSKPRVRGICIQRFGCAQAGVGEHARLWRAAGGEHLSQSPSPTPLPNPPPQAGRGERAARLH